MSNGEPGNGEVTVEDEEHYVDRKTKEQILTLRSQIDDDERSLYVDRVGSPQLAYSRSDADRDWGLSVRQYLRGIKRLWSEADNTGVKNVSYYWRDANIGTKVIYPPDKNGFRFSQARLIDNPAYSEYDVRREIGLGRGVDIPEPYIEQFKGLSDVLNKNQIRHQWHIKTDREGPPPEHNKETVAIEAPVPKDILETAVETADTFLQQAGIGFNTTVPDYMATGEPGL